MICKAATVGRAAVLTRGIRVTVLGYVAYLTNN